MQQEIYNLQDLTGMVRRRRRVVAGVFLGFILTSLVVAYSLENVYRGSGAILIERPEVAGGFLPGATLETGSEERQQRIMRLYEEVTAKANLAPIIDKFDLYAQERGDSRAESVAWLVKENTEIKFVTTDDDPRSKFAGGTIGFRISFYYPNPLTARDVARELMDRMLDAHSRRRQVAYDETKSALTREADNLRVAVSSAEGILAEFKEDHPGELPSDRNYNIQIMERKVRDRDGLDREIRGLQDRKTILQSQLARTDPWISAVGPDGTPLPASSEHLQNLQAEYLRLLSSYSMDHPDVIRLRREIDALTGGEANPAFRQALEAELLTRRTELLEMRRQYGPEYPDVRAQERAVTKLEQQIAAIPAESRDTPEPNNPAYINLQLQLRAANNEMAALNVTRRRLRTEILELEGMVQISPAVEREYLSLTRDLDIVRKQYDDIKAREMSADIASVLTEKDLAEKYLVQNYPQASSIPAYPNRPLLLAAGLFLGLTFGIGIGIVAEALDGTVRNTRDISKLLDMPPIAAIPIVLSVADIRKNRSRHVAQSVAVVAMITVVVTYVQLQRTGVI